MAPLLASARFRRFALAKALQLIAQNALVYGLFIIVISRQESALATSAFVLASVIPSIFLSVPAGVIADALPKKPQLLASMAARIVIVWMLLQFELGLTQAIGLTFLTWTAYQFFTPPENAALPAVVARPKLAGAVSFLHALSLIAQVAGAGLIAPLMTKTLGPDALLWTVLALLSASALLYAFVPHLSPRHEARTAAGGWWRSLPEGLRALSADPELARTTALKVMLDTGTMMLVVAAPEFVEDVLDTGPENAIYLAMPAALGLGLGLALAPGLLTFARPRPLAFAGFALFGISVMALPFGGEVAPGAVRDAASIVGLSSTTLMAVLLLPFAGLGTGLLQVSARAHTYSRADPAIVSQVLATQSAIGSTAALLPTLASGLMLDVLPVEAVLSLIGGSLLALGSAVALRPAGAVTAGEAAP